MNLEEMKAAAATEVKPKSDVIEVERFGSLVQIRFELADYSLWTEQILLHPPRPTQVLDLRNGYNLDSLTRTLAPLTGYQVVDGEDTKESSEWWDLFFKNLPGIAFDKIRNAVYTLNEVGPENKVSALKKALAVNSEKTPS